MKQYVEHDIKLKVELPPKEGEVQENTNQKPVKKEAHLLFE